MCGSASSQLSYLMCMRRSRNNGGRVPTGDVSRLGPPPEWEMTGMGGKPSKGTPADRRLASKRPAQAKQMPKQQMPQMPQMPKRMPKQMPPAASMMPQCK